MQANNFSWSSLVDTFWVDNPVGVGFATADSTGYGKAVLNFTNNVPFILVIKYRRISFWKPLRTSLGIKYTKKLQDIKKATEN